LALPDLTLVTLAVKGGRVVGRATRIRAWGAGKRRGRKNSRDSAKT
jgi:hypothetical protein